MACAENILKIIAQTVYRNLLMNSLRSLSSLIVLFGSIIFTPLSSHAQENQAAPPLLGYDLYLSKGVSALNQKKYSQAIQDLTEALREKTNDLDATYYLGVALNKAGRNQEAETNLKKVLKLDPSYGRAHFNLGIVEYELKKYPDALQNLQQAEKEDPGNPLIPYYQGLTYHHRGDYERSSPKFLRAAVLAPDLGLTAHYYAGVGFYHRGLVEEARDELQEVVRIDPASEVARSAQEFLKNLEPHKKKAKPWDVTLSTAYQYDSNVVLLPGGSPLPTGISQQHDHRFVIFGRGGYRIFERSQWSGGASYDFYQSFHTELNAFNVQNHGGSAFVQYHQKRWQLRIPYKFNFALVDGDSFLLSHTIKPLLTIKETPRLKTYLSYGFSSKDFKNTSSFSTNSDRDGNNHLASITQSVGFAKTGRIRMGYTYDRELTGDSPTQDDWDYQGHKFFGALRLPPFNGLTFDMGIDYTHQDYKHPNSSSPTQSEREDKIQTYNANLAKTLGKWVTATVQYIYDKNDSNLPVFDYDRHIVSVIFSGAF
ncbi:MAG TPA: tetratricopeptide repeat protein [Nitrospiria bacterium]